jgi:hypothetical protein
VEKSLYTCSIYRKKLIPRRRPETVKWPLLTNMSKYHINLVTFSEDDFFLAL